MRGKFITTSLKLAVMSGNKKIKTTEVLETKASIEHHELIWKKIATALDEKTSTIVKREELAVAV